MTITADKQGVCLILHGREQLWALRAKIVIPKKDIMNVEYVSEFSDWRKLEVRLPGASVPGKLVAGSYWTEEGWDFLYIKNPRGFIKPRADNVLVIETNQNRFKRIIVSADATSAAEILAWWKAKAS